MINPSAQPANAANKAANNIEDAYPLSPLQEGMLFHAIADSSPGTYIQAFRCDLTGPIDLSAFEQACQTVVNRHPVLRTAFAWKNMPKPLQIVGREVSIKLNYADVQALDSAAQQGWLQALVDREHKAGFDMTRAPLMRFHLVQLQANRFHFVWLYHHLLLDGTSVPMLTDELLKAHAAKTPTIATAPARRNFRTYIDWLQKQDLPAAEAFWKSELAGFDTATRMIFQKTISDEGDKGDEAEHRYDEVVTELPDDLYQHLREAARAHRLTLSTVCHAAWARLLALYSGQSDVVFGSVISHRPVELPGAEAMIGVLINTLPLRVHTRPDVAVADWMRDLQHAQSRTQAFAHTPLAKIQDWSEVPRNHPLFESILVFENQGAVAEDNSAYGGVCIANVTALDQPNFPISVMVLPGKHLLLRVIYNRACYEHTHVQAIVARLGAILESFARNMTTPLGNLPFLSEAETQAWVHDTNQTHSDFPRELNLAQLFQQQVARAPQAIAITASGNHVSYGQLDHEATRLAARLQGAGVQPGQRVAVVLDSSARFVVAVLACLKTGAAYVPIDPTYPADRIDYMMADAQTSAVLTEDKYLSLISAMTTAATTNGPVTLVNLDQPEAMQADRAAPAPVLATSQSAAYVMYTSGSTGKPKGIVVPHVGVARLVLNTHYIPFSPSDRIALASNVSFDAATFEIWGALLHGGQLCPIARQTLLSPNDLAACIRQQAIRTLFLTTALFNQICQTQPETFGALDYLLFGGDAVNVAAVRQVVTQTQAPQHLVHCYGPTECTTFALCHPVASTNVTATTSLPIGRPIANTTAYVLNNTFHPVPAGMVGELFLGGEGLAWGYHNRPELTADKFVPDPFGSEPGARLYRTGDLVMMDATGAITFVGRADNQVKIRGFRIELGEIESVLAAHPSVKDGVVLVHEPKPGDKRLVAFLVAAAKPAPSIRELRQFLKAALPDYMVPASFIALSELPVTPNGKVDRKALLALLRTQQTATPDAQYQAPRTEPERILAEIWSQVLNLPRVGTRDNYFELGGDSIRALQIASKANAAGLAVTTKKLFNHPTIAELAQAAQSQTPAANPSPAEYHDNPIPLTPIQHWFFEQALPEPHCFNQTVTLRADEALDEACVESAARWLCAQHDSLRLCFVPTPTGLQQTEGAPSDEPICTWFDLSAVEPATKLEVARQAVASLQHALNLEQGRLLRIAVCKLEEAHYQLTLICHHLAIDAMSWGIVLQDFECAYQALRRGTAIPDRAPTTPFRLWANHVQAYAQSAGLRQEVGYWTALLQDHAQQNLPLRTDFAEGVNDVASIRTLSAVLDKLHTDQLERSLQKTLAVQWVDGLLAGLGHALQAWNGACATTIDFESYGRADLHEDINLTRSVGWFTSIYPVPLRCEPGEKVEQTARRLSRQLAKVPALGTGYGALRYLAQAAVPITQSPILFNFSGRIDSSFSSFSNSAPSQLFQFVSAELERGTRGDRPYPFDLNLSLMNECLHIDLTYSANLHLEATAHSLLAAYIRVLKEMAALHAPTDGADVATPGLGRTRLSAASMSRLITRMGQTQKTHEPANA